MFSLYYVSESQTHSSNTASLFQMSKQQVLKTPPPLNVVTELSISLDLRYNACCAPRAEVAVCTHSGGFKMDEIFRNIKFLEK